MGQLQVSDKEARNQASKHANAMKRLRGAKIRNFEVVKLPIGQMASILSIFRALPSRKRAG